MFKVNDNKGSLKANFIVDSACLFPGIQQLVGLTRVSIAILTIAKEILAHYGYRRTIAQLKQSIKVLNTPDLLPVKDAKIHTSKIDEKKVTDLSVELELKNKEDSSQRLIRAISFLFNGLLVANPSYR